MIVYTNPTLGLEGLKDNTRPRYTCQGKHARVVDRLLEKEVLLQEARQKVVLEKGPQSG